MGKKERKRNGRKQKEKMGTMKGGEKEGKRIGKRKKEQRVEWGNKVKNWLRRERMVNGRNIKKKNGIGIIFCNNLYFFRIR